MSSDDDTTEPTELDPGMVEKARAAFEAMNVAQQERDRLRAGIESVQKAIENNRGIDNAWDTLRALLAGSGEQPSDWASRVNQASLDASRHPHRPAPVVPELDEGGPRACGCAAAWTCEHDAPVVPDSPDVYETIRAFIEEEVGFDGGPGMDDQARRLTDRVLAVVGQGVTAGCDDREPHTDCEPHLTVWADGATAEQREAIYEAAMGAAFTAAEGMDGVDVGGVGTLSDNRDAVRPTGQEQAGG